MENTLNTLKNTQEKKRLASIDIFRIFLTLMVLALHATNGIFMADLSKPPLGGVSIGGFLACEAFFMISGFFVAKAAYQKEATSVWRYTFRKVWHYIPILVLAVLLSFVTASIASTIYLQPEFSPMVFIFAPTWYMWFLFISCLVLYPCLKKWKSNFALFGLLGFVVCFVALYFMNGEVGYNFVAGDPFWKFTLFGFFTSFFRSTGCMWFGAFCYAIYLLIKDKQIRNWIRIIMTLLGLIALTTATFFTYWQPASIWDFMVVGMFAIFSFILLTNIGALSSKIILPSSICKGIADWSLYTYTGQYIIIGLFAVINKNDGGWQQGGLLDYLSWWVISIGMSIVGGILMGFGLGWIHKKTQKHILSKCKKLNSI